MSAPERGLLYTTLRGEGHGELEDRRSVFLSHAAPVRTEEEALAFVKARQKEFSDATHNVWAFRLGADTVARYSDDGEPQGSSGMPTLEAIRHTGATDAVVVVTRYFGGTLLGVGGLIRAYSSAARLAPTTAWPPPESQDLRAARRKSPSARCGSPWRHPGRRSQSSNSAEPTGDRSSTAPAPSPSACCATA